MKSRFFFSMFLLAGLFFAACKGHHPKNETSAVPAGTPVKYQCPMDCERANCTTSPAPAPFAIWTS